MTRHFALAAAVLSVAACNSDRLTGVAAEDAARQYQVADLDVSTAPLFIVDGREVSADVALAIAPASIATIEIVKGAAAVRVYGERGSRGVVLVTRKE